MTTAVREPRVRRAATRTGGPRVPAYVTASKRRSRGEVVLGDRPWGRRDRDIAIGGSVLGLAGLAVCSWGGAGEVDLATQMRWLLGGIGAVVVSALCLVHWLLAGLRTVRIEMARVFSTITPNRSVVGAAATGGRVVTVAGMVRFHRPECPLVAGKAIRVLDPADAAAEGLRPCGACES
ncbi:MAG TPA: hypothetical protein VHU88_13385 [Sporichthyaceae bacterium]|nr:hypothetical protein [Sporichthyaceae bacterium]